MKFLLVLICIFPLMASAQFNGLYNGNFENLFSQPNASGQIDKAIGWKKIIPDSDLLGPSYYGNDQIPFDFTGNYYMGFYSGAEIAENLFTRHLLKGEIYKIRFKFGHNGNNGKLSFSMLNKFVLEQDYTTSGTNYNCKPANKKISHRITFDVGTNFQTANQWHTYESEWLVASENLTGIAVGYIHREKQQQNNCYELQSGDNGYIFMDDIEILTAGSCPTCNKMNLPLVPGYKMYSFTPNTDGQDDIFFHEYENMTSYDLYVFDRSGLRVFCAKDQWPAIGPYGKPAIAWDGSKTNYNCEKIGGKIDQDVYTIAYTVRNCSYTYTMYSYSIIKGSKGNNGNEPSLFPADPQYWGCCVKNYHIKDQTLTHTPHASSNPDLWYRASEWILAENSTVKTGAEVRFTAGDVITLTTGFTVEAGADFEAYIQLCATQKTDFQSLTESTTEILENISENPEEETQSKAAEHPSLRIYPNPFGTELSIQSETELLEVWLTDLYGRKIISSNSLQTNTYTLSTQVLSSGCYILHLRTENGISTHKVCKE